MLFDMLFSWISRGRFGNLYSAIGARLGILGTSGGTVLFVAFIALCIAIPYLLGSINTSIILSKAIYHDDIRSHGSGNAGATNALRTYGKKFGALTFLGDFFKAVIATFIGSLLLSGTFGGAIAGLFVMVGHMFPIYYNFKGGKGVACAAAVVLFLEPISFLILFTFFVIIVIGTKYVSFGSCMAIALFPVIASMIQKLYIVFTGQGLGAVPVVGVIMAALVIYMHRANIKRLLNGTESKLSFGKKKEEGKEKPHTKEEKLEAKREETRAFREKREKEAKEYSDDKFCECECGRLIPKSRKACAYCGKKNPSYTDKK